MVKKEDLTLLENKLVEVYTCLMHNF